MSEGGFKKYLKEFRFPTSWCPGCGNGIVMKLTAQAFEEFGFTNEDVTIVSGIGCAGRTAGYFNLDTVHTLHGRAICVAEGIKFANPKIKVVVISGDGDLLAIGGNHILHAARRGTEMTVICIDNQVYGMTGGQKSPTAKLGVKTLTTPQGNLEKAMDLQAVVKTYDNFFARSTVFHINHLKKCIKEALEYKGFSFVQVISQCHPNYGRRAGFKDAYDMLMHFKSEYELKEGIDILGEHDIGVLR